MLVHMREWWRTSLCLFSSYYFVRKSINETFMDKDEKSEVGFVLRQVCDPQLCRM